MKPLGLAGLVLFVISLSGCVMAQHQVASVDRRGTSGDYCHKKLKPIGPTDPGKPNQIGGDDFIDYYGPCDGPSAAEQMEAQRRFEQFRWGRDYMDEG
jgi:hypothetical protein